MGFISKLKQFFTKKKKKVNPQNNMGNLVLQTPISIMDNNDNFMPVPQAYMSYSASTMDVSGIFDIEDEATNYKAQRDEKLQTFKANKEKAKKSKVDKAAEEKERAWIKEIIKIAKQPKPDGKTT